MMSRGVAPSAFRARTTSSRVVPDPRFTSFASPSATSTFSSGTVTVSPRFEKGLGCDVL